jgi:hypothetical protein
MDRRQWRIALGLEFIAWIWEFNEGKCYIRR